MVPLVTTAAAAPGEVTLPLAEWQALAPPPAAAPAPTALPVARTLVGRVERGVFVGTVSTTFDVTGGPVEVPVAPVAASLTRGSADGRPTTFGSDGTWQTVTLPPGAHDVEIGVVQGRDTDRFARALALPLPPGPPTAFRLTLPEAPVDAVLAGGVLGATRADGASTVVEGWLDAAGTLSLTWERRAEHRASLGDASLATRVDAVVEVDRDVTAGTARYAVDVRSGAVDQLSFQVPPGVEILEVTGSAVLQWQTAADGRLRVLLRRVVEDHVDAVVRYQYPAADRGAVVFPVPLGRMSGVVGVEAPVALELAVTSVEHGRVLDPRDVPPSVLELTPDPLAVVVAFDEVMPAITVTSTPRPPVTSSVSRIDDLQGLTVLGDDGGEVGKLRLTVRNTSRQVLAVDLPEGAHLTHCFRDGLPLRPASDPARPDRALIPLLRSERSAAAEHVVAPGETLSSIALARFGTADAWTAVAAANPLANTHHLAVGQHLVIPADGANEERSFVLELAWERRTPPVSLVGRRTVALPTLDLPVSSADWHVYLPQDLELLSVATALDPVDAPSLWSRVGDVFAADLGASPAYAGEAYSNSLVTRRSKWEAKQQQEVLGVDPFPLVGRRLAFSGRLLGTTPPTLTVTWVAGLVGDGLRVSVLALAAAATALAAWSPRRPWPWLALAAVVVTGLGLGVPLLGVWRHLVWGLDLGLLVGLGLRRAPVGLLLEGLAFSVLVGALCGGVSSSVAAVLLLPVLLLANGRAR